MKISIIFYNSMVTTFQEGENSQPCPENYRLNLIWFKDIIQGIAGCQGSLLGAIFSSIPYEHRPLPADFIPKFSPLIYRLFEKPYLFRQGLLFSLQELGTFLGEANINYNQNAENLREIYSAILEEIKDYSPTPIHLGRSLSVISSLLAKIYAARGEKDLADLEALVMELIKIVKPISRNDIQFRSALGGHGLQLLIPVLKENNIDIEKLSFIAGLTSDVSSEKPGGTKDRLQEFQEFKDTIKKVRDFINALGNAGYKGEKINPFLNELAVYRDIALRREHPAKKFRGLIIDTKKWLTKTGR